MDPIGRSKMMSEEEFIARSEVIRIEEVISEIRKLLIGSSQKEVRLHLGVANDALLDAISLIQEKQQK